MAQQLDAKAIALAGGLTWALAVFLAGLGSMIIPGWQTMVTWLGQFYIGYAPTAFGSIIGALWGFVDFFIWLFVFVWLYNYFHERFGSKG